MSTPMASRIEQYAMIGDTQTAALVGDDGSIDWFCAPRFDCGACFAALLGDAEPRPLADRPAAGAAPRVGDTAMTRSCSRPSSTHPTARAGHRLHADPRRDRRLIRIVEGVRGHGPMRMHLTIRFDYGQHLPGCATSMEPSPPSPARTRSFCAHRSRRVARPHDRRRVHRQARATSRLQPHLVPVSPGHATAPERDPVAEPDGEVVAQLGEEVDLRRRLAARRFSGR